MANFKRPGSDPSQQWLFARSLDELVPADCDVRVFSQMMDRLDWSTLESGYARLGRPAYDPRVLAKLLVFAYAHGVRSSRKVEELVRYDVRYMWLTGELKPDYRTIARFRKDRSLALKALFASSVHLCVELGLVDLEVVAIDGTKIRANASGRTVYDARRVERGMAYAEKVLQEAEEADGAEGGSDEEGLGGGSSQLPGRIKHPGKRLERLQELRTELEGSGAKGVSASEPDSRLMKSSEGVKPCYNLQAAVDGKAQVIVALEVKQTAADYGLLPEMDCELRATLGRRAGMLLADGGYASPEALRYLEECGQDALIAQQSRKSQYRGAEEYSREHFVYDAAQDVYRCPEGNVLRFRGFRAQWGGFRLYRARGCPACPQYRRCVPSGRASRELSVSAVQEMRSRMAARLADEQGKQLYRRRAAIVEPVNGQLKQDRGLRRFLARGLEAVKAEASLAALAHNLLKCAGVLLVVIFRNIAAPAGPAATAFRFYPSRRPSQRQSRLCPASP